MFADSPSSAELTLQSALGALKAQFATCPMPSVAQRRALLLALKRALLAQQQPLCDALAQDFGQRSATNSQLLEVMPCIEHINFSLKRLKRWLGNERRGVSWLFWPASNRVMYQPKGVVGVMVPWNYPLYLTLAPLVTALAAGNRVMIKLSEFTPQFNQAISALLSEHLGDHWVRCFSGEVDEAVAFSQLPLDHLFFTGSTANGRRVMHAAARNLTPVTLELGGKSPFIVGLDADIPSAVRQLLFGKTANGGQTCIAPDYALVPKSQRSAFIDEVKVQFQAMYPDFANNADYVSIINDRQFQRLRALLNGLSAEHWQSCASTAEHDIALQRKRLMPLVLAYDLPQDHPLLTEEIFGPILPIIDYQHLDDAIAWINNRPRPLALYLSSHDRTTINKVLQHTHSGGVTINGSLYHIAQDQLPFGGVGESGMGNYHGDEGFKTFSHAKAVHRRFKLDISHWVQPPYQRKPISLSKLLLRLLLGKQG